MSIKKAAVLVMCAVLMIVCITAVMKQPSRLEYLFLSPKTETQNKDDPSGGEKENEKPAQGTLLAAVRNIEKQAESWPGIIEKWTVTTENEQVSIRGNQKEKKAHLTGVWDTQEAFSDRLIRFGRNFYPEELKNGEKVILLDEKLALDLFRVGDPVGRKVTAAGSEYRVIGIFRHRRSIGDSEEYLAYVPLTALEKENFQTQVIKVSAVSIPAAGAQTAFKISMMSAFPNGSLYNLANEQYRALLPVRYLMVFCGILFLMRGFKVCKKICSLMYRDYQAQLKKKYAQQLLLKSTGYIAAGLILYAALIFLTAVIFTFALNPVYVFPEWVPSVPVEWTEISKTFWNLRTMENAMIEIRSPYVNELRFLRSVLTGLSVLTGALILTQKYQMLLKRKEKQMQNK